MCSLRKIYYLEPRGPERFPSSFYGPEVYCSEVWETTWSISSPELGFRSWAVPREWVRVETVWCPMGNEKGFDVEARDRSVDVWR